MGVLTLFAARPASASELIRNLEAKKPQTVVFYGTSVSTGGWTNLVARELTDKYGKDLVKPVFSGMPGNQSRNGIANLKGKVLDNKPDAVFIEFAINDAHKKFGITPQESKENLLKMIKTLREQNPKVEIILSTMNDVIDVNGKTSGTDRPQLAEYYQGYRDVAAEQKCLLVDHYKNWLELKKKDEATFKRYLPDGLHPNADAAKALILPAVMQVLTGEPAKQ